MKPLKIYEKNFSRLWKMHKDLTRSTAYSLPRGGCLYRVSPACTFELAKQTWQRQWQNSCTVWLLEQNLPPCTYPSSDVGSQSQVIFLHFLLQIIDWMMCTLIIFQEDFVYLCCTFVGKALNKYFMVVKTKNKKQPLSDSVTLRH